MVNCSGGCGFLATPLLTPIPKLTKQIFFQQIFFNYVPQLMTNLLNHNVQDEQEYFS